MASLLTGRNHIRKEHDHSPQTGAARWIPYFWFCYGLPRELYTDSSVGAFRLCTLPIVFLLNFKMI